MTYFNNLGQGRVGFRTPSGLTPLLLDTYSGAAAAYSLRKLRNDYTGSAITVRRSSDNTSTNIGFDANGNLDTTALTTFVGSNNTALYSEEFDNVWWNKNNVTVTTNQTMAPDGTMTADLLSESGTLNHAIGNTVASSTFTSGTSWNVSVYLKKGPGTSAPDTIALSFSNGNILNTPSVLFNISTGVVVTSSNPWNDANFGSSIVDVGGGWWRCAMWGTTTISQGRSAQYGVIRFNNNLNTITTAYYTGNVQANVYIWGYQFVRALNNTSVLTTQPYTKTTTTAAGNGFVSVWFDQSGNNNNQSSSTLIKQPQIVNSGSLITRNGKPAIYFSNNMMQSGRVFSTSNFSIFSTLSGNSGQSNNVLLCQHTGAADVGRTVFIQPSDVASPYNKLKTFFNNGTSYSIISNNVVFDNALKLVNITSNGSGTTTQFVNSTQEGILSGQSWTPINALTTLGSLGNTFSPYTGYVGELVMYATNQLTNRTGIESNINTYYTIY